MREEGTAFADLLERTRRDLAQRYLVRVNLSLAEASYLLGFSDQSNFFRACKRWFGLSLSQYRAKLAKGEY